MNIITPERLALLVPIAGFDVKPKWFKPAAPLKRRIHDVLRRHPESTYSVVRTHFGEAEHKQIQALLDKMVVEGTLTIAVKHGRKKDMRVYSVRTWTYEGKPINLSQLVGHPDNTHKFNKSALRKRLLKGMTPEQALGIGHCGERGKGGRGQLDARIMAWEDDGF